VIPSHEITLEAALRDLDHPKPEVRARAAGALGSCEEEDRAQAAAALRRALGDERGEVRYAAAMSLAELCDAGALDELVGQLEDGDPRAREAAAIALGKSGARDRVWQPLCAALFDGPPEVRFQAAASLGELDAGLAAPHLLRALTDTDPEVRGSAACALGEAPPSPEASSALAGLLGDRFEEPRFEAAYTLARYRDRRATPILLKFLADPGRAYDAACALGLLDDPQATEPLRRLLRRWFAPALVKVRVAEALARLGAAEGRVFLEKAAQRRRDDVSGLARELLAGLPGVAR
jgi:HEAT repeat protein